MTNHVHMIVSKTTDTLLGAIIRYMKKFMSSILIEAIQSNREESRREWLLELFRKAGKGNSNNKIYRIWQQGNHPIQCSTADILKKYEDWLWSSASDYYLGRKGLIDLSYV